MTVEAGGKEGDDIDDWKLADFGKDAIRNTLSTICTATVIHIRLRYFRCIPGCQDCFRITSDSRSIAMRLLYAFDQLLFL